MCRCVLRAWVIVPPELQRCVFISPPPIDIVLFQQPREVFLIG